MKLRSASSMRSTRFALSRSERAMSSISSIPDADDGAVKSPSPTRPALRANRLALLAALERLFGETADLSLLPG